MRFIYRIKSPPTQGSSWEERWEGPDKGLLCAWLRGIAKAREDPSLAARAKAGELPILAWKGGVAKALKARTKVGSIMYFATWRGLRGEDLDINDEEELQLVCSKTGVLVTYTRDRERLLSDTDQEE